MDIAAMNEKITIQKNKTLVDDIGNHTNAWNDYHLCYATVGGENRVGSSETAVAGTTADNADITFTVRYCKAVGSISTDGYRILFHGEIYNILSIDHMNYKKKAIKFKCRKVRR